MADAAEFYDPRKDDLMRVEKLPGGYVQIYLARDGFVPTQRWTFIRYLKAEGFIPEETRRVIWSFDPRRSLPEAGSNGFGRRLLLGLTAGWTLLI